MELKDIAKILLPKLLILESELLRREDLATGVFLNSLGMVNSGRPWWGNDRDIVNAWITYIRKAIGGDPQHISHEWCEAVMNSANALYKYIKAEG